MRPTTRLFSLKLCQECGFNSCVRVFFIPWGHVSNHAQIWAFVTSISHMGEMRDSDWSRQILLRSDWLLPIGAIMTTSIAIKLFARVVLKSLQVLAERFYPESSCDFPAKRSILLGLIACPSRQSIWSVWPRLRRNGHKHYL